MKPNFFFPNRLGLVCTPEVLAVDTKSGANHLSIIEWCSNALLFTLVYSIIPFYTGTQNTYFLHGLVQAGYGFLEYDWLAKTTDSKPAFSFLVEAVYKLTDVYGFYVLYVLLLGIYINSIIHIINYATHYFFRTNAFYRLSLFAVLLILHAGVLYDFFSKLGIQIEQIFPEGLAQQTVIDHYFQSQTFGVFLLLSIVFFLKKQYYHSVVAACFAALIHISYLIPAALITLTCMGFIFFREKNVLKALKVGLTGLLLVSPILFYTIDTLMPLSDQAKDILYIYRIRHHADPHFWSLSRTALKIVFMLLAFVILKDERPLFILYGVLLTFSLVFTLIQIVTGSKDIALTFPWRVSVILFPLAVGLISAQLLRLLLSFLKKKAMNVKATKVGLYVLIGLLAGGGCVISAEKFNKRRKFDTSMQEIISQMNLPQHKNFSILIPTKLEDFRLSTGLPVYVDYKSHPYQSDELEEWYERVQMNERFYNHQMNEGEIANFFKKHHIFYILTYAENGLPESRYYKQEYTNQKYILYSTSLLDNP